MTHKTAEWVMVTPQMAEAWLLRNESNRPIRKWWVASLAAMLRRGEWIATHQGVAFTESGRLLDGQHRLMAIMESGIPAEMLVVTGLSSTAFMAIDIGVKRALSDVTGLTKGEAEVCRLACALLSGSTSATPQRVLGIARAGVVDTHRVLVDHCPTTTKFFSSAPMRLAAVVRILEGHPISWVIETYGHLVWLHVDDWTPLGRALVKQVMQGHAIATNTTDTLARGLRVFDSSEQQKNATKMQISDASLAAAVETVRRALKPLLSSEHSSQEVAP